MCIRDRIRCRKKLIDAAIFPKLAAKTPPNGYVGPTFSCEECEDTWVVDIFLSLNQRKPLCLITIIFSRFVSEDSLKNHKDRRSVLFKYDCPSCEQHLEFYNRCMFLLHIRSHDSTIKASHLNIEIIPANKLKFKVLEDNEESLLSLIHISEPTRPY